MHDDARVFVVVETRALQLAIVHPEAERLDQVKLGRGVRGEPDHVARVGRNLRMHEHDGKWRRRRRRGGIAHPPPRAQRSRDDPALDARGTGAGERPRSLGERRPGGHHVVDECDARAVHVPASGEGAADVGGALGP